MPMQWKYYLLSALFTFFSGFIFGQTGKDSLIGKYIPRTVAEELPPPVNEPPAPVSKFLVGEIVIEGNTRTRPNIIHRELPFRPGDSVTLTELVGSFEIARHQLMNTRLFNEVVVALKSFRGRIVDVSIVVKERWYLFPIPYVKFVDRNLSEWAKQDFATDRLNYGFKLTHYNFTGRNDKLKLWLITGYTKSAQFLYEQPYADKSMKHGFRVGFSYSQNREVNYSTENNLQVFLDSSSGNKTFYGNIDYTYRPGLRTFHTVSLGYRYMKVDPAIVELNPHYLSKGKTELKQPELSYKIRYINTDYIPYPLEGWMGEASITRAGFTKDRSMTQLTASYVQSWPVGNDYYFHVQGYGLLRVPFTQPFVNSNFLGYGDYYLRGLEKYVVDGVAGMLWRNTFRKKLLEFSVPTFLKSESHSHIPFTIFAKAYSDFGYSRNKIFNQNNLTNKILYSAGLGIDILSFYDFVIRIDYSFNQMGERGFFFHFSNEF